MKGRVVDDAILILAEDDTVATVLADLEAGQPLSVDGEVIEIAEGIPFGHKVALTTHAAGAEIRKYGEVIGRATEAIDPGHHVHTHNVESTRGRGDVPRAGSA